jgi:hypothetical protein
MPELTSPNTCRWRGGWRWVDGPGTAYDAAPPTRLPPSFRDGITP